jgi:hypothetical protein
MRDLAGLIADLGDVALVTDPARVQQKSRDFYWYSPLLQRQLEHVWSSRRAKPRWSARCAPAIAIACR